MPPPIRLRQCLPLGRDHSSDRSATVSGPLDRTSETSARYRRYPHHGASPAAAWAGIWPQSPRRILPGRPFRRPRTTVLDPGGNSVRRLRRIACQLDNKTCCRIARGMLRESGFTPRPLSRCRVRTSEVVAARLKPPNRSLAAPLWIASLGSQGLTLPGLLPSSLPVRPGIALGPTPSRLSVSPPERPRATLGPLRSSHA